MYIYTSHYKIDSVVIDKLYIRRIKCARYRRATSIVTSPPKLSIVYCDKTGTLALLGTRHIGRYVSIYFKDFLKRNSVDLRINCPVLPSNSRYKIFLWNFVQSNFSSSNQLQKDRAQLQKKCELMIKSGLINVIDSHNHVFDY